ncbi:MAG: Hint domain-containing protein [Pseudomonadota bacterium]
MGWIGLTDRQGGRFAAAGLGDAPGCTRDLLTRGTLLVEIDLPDPVRPVPLFGYTLTHPWARHLMLQALPGGHLVLVQAQGEAVRHAALHLPPLEPAETLRVSYAWDSVQGWGRIAVERPGKSGAEVAQVHAPLPQHMDDLEALMLGRPGRVMATCVSFAALSGRIEPIGPLPSLHPETPVATPQGYRAAGEIVAGDQVMTPGGAATVCAQVRRTLPARGQFAPVQLSAPYLGLAGDIVVAPDQRLVQSGSAVEYLFGEEAVLVPAHHLAAGHVGRPAPTGPLAEYVQLVLPQHEPILTAGTWTESLYVGRLRRKPAALAASALAGVDRAMLPEHGKPAFPVLRRYDALVLADSRAA